MALRKESTRIQITPTSVLVRGVDGEPLDLPHLWLRDNCECGECRIAQTGEKRFIVSQVPVDIVPRDAVLIDNRLVVTWPDGHVTHYSFAAIRAPREPRYPPWQAWPKHFSPRRVDWDDLLLSDAAAIDALERFVVDGVLVLTGAPREPLTLEALASRLGPLREVVFDRIHDVQVNAAGYNVAHTALALPPHNDFASYTWPPSVQALHMLANDAVGGATIIVDGWSLLERYRAENPRFFDCLCRVSVPFSMWDKDTVTWAEAPLIRLDTDANITGFRFSNQLMQRMDPRQDSIGQFYRAYHELCRRIHDAAFRVAFRLDAGQVLLVAAHRVLHAREGFTPQGRRHLQDAYFEFDNVANHLVVLRQKEGQGDV